MEGHKYETHKNSSRIGTCKLWSYISVVKEAMDAGVDYVHSDAADMHDLKKYATYGWSSNNRNNKTSDR